MRTRPVQLRCERHSRLRQRLVVFPTANSDVRGQWCGCARLPRRLQQSLYRTGFDGHLSDATRPGNPALGALRLQHFDGNQWKGRRSPILSLDGKKIAFVESNDGSGSTYTAFHVLTWKSGEGTAWSSAAAPGDCSGGNSCMTTLVLNSTRSDSGSSPFVDYAHDTAYVGDDSGRLHKITPVFTGTPVEVIGSG
jgi:hypothetical protein